MGNTVIPAPHVPTKWDRFKGRFLQGVERIDADAAAGAGPVVMTPFLGGNPMVRWLAPLIGRLAMWVLVAFVIVAGALLILSKLASLFH